MLHILLFVAKSASIQPRTGLGKVEKPTPLKRQSGVSGGEARDAAGARAPGGHGLPGLLERQGGAREGGRLRTPVNNFEYCAYHINRDNSRRVLYSDVIRKVFFTTFARGVSRDQTRFFYGNISNLN